MSTGSSSKKLLYVENAAGAVLDVKGDGSTYVKLPGWPLKNELTNSGFDVWSNSTLEDATNSELLSTFANQNFDTVPGSSSWNGAFVNDAGGWGVGQQAVSLTAGKLYKLSFDASSLSGVATTFGTASDTNGANLTGVSITSATGQSYVFEASATTTYIMLHTTSADASGFTLANVSLKEVVPGCVSSGAENFDGWQRRGGTSAKCYRQHEDATFTKDGSFYSLKTISTESAWNHAWPDATLITDKKFLARFAGRTVTAGCWVYSTLSTPEIRLNIYTNSGDNFSTQTVSQNTWTWLETTAECPGALTNFQVQFNKSGATSETYYISQPMLVFGSAIGEGNYSRPQGEIVWFEKRKISNTLQGTGHSDVSATTLNAEADTNGIVPKGARALFFSGETNDSASSTTDTFLRLQADSTVGLSFYASCGGLANDKTARASAWQACDSNGDFQYQIAASGSGTLDLGLNYVGVQLR